MNVAPTSNSLQHFHLGPVLQGPTPSTEKGISPNVSMPPPRVVKIEFVSDEPVAHRTRSRISALSALSAAGRTFPSEFLEQWEASEVIHRNQRSPLALSVLDTKTGASLEHRALRRNPRLSKTRNTSYIKNLGQLCQGMGTEPKEPTKKLVNGTNTFHVIRYEDIPLDRQKGIAFSKVVWTFRRKKSGPNRTCITIAGQNITYPGKVGTRTASLDLIKLLLSSVLSNGP